MQQVLCCNSIYNLWKSWSSLSQCTTEKSGKYPGYHSIINALVMYPNCIILCISALESNAQGPVSPKELECVIEGSLVEPPPLPPKHLNLAHLSTHNVAGSQNTVAGKVVVGGGQVIIRRLK